MVFSRGHLLFKHEFLLPFIHSGTTVPEFGLKNQDEVQVQIKFKAWLLKMWVTSAKHLTSELPQFHSFMHAFIFC